MDAILRLFRTQWLGAIGILVGLTGVAFGAAGQPAILGQTNQSNAPTVLQNTAGGPALSFVTKAKQSPFTVTSSKQVPRLNASTLAGKRPGAFAKAGESYSKKQSDGRYAPLSGSSQYLSSSSPQLLRITNAKAFPSGADVGVTLFDEDLAVPGTGTVYLRFTGECSTGAIAGMALDVGAEHGVLLVAKGDDLDACNRTVWGEVTAGSTVHAAVSFGNSSTPGTESLVDGVIEVIFQPHN